MTSWNTDHLHRASSRISQWARLKHADIINIKLSEFEKYENASTEKSSTGDGIIKYGKIKYDCAGMEIASTEKQVKMCKDGMCKYGKMKYDWAGVENASTNSAGKVKHNNSPIILRSGKQLSPCSFFKLVNF